jgi:hypothetical protein
MSLYARGITLRSTTCGMKDDELRLLALRSYLRNAATAYLKLPLA